LIRDHLFRNSAILSLIRFEAMPRYFGVSSFASRVIINTLLTGERFMVNQWR